MSSIVGFVCVYESHIVIQYCEQGELTYGGLRPEICADPDSPILDIIEEVLTNSLK